MPKIVQLEPEKSEPSPKDVLALAKWMHATTQEVMKSIAGASSKIEYLTWDKLNDGTRRRYVGLVKRMLTDPPSQLSNLT